MVLRPPRREEMRDAFTPRVQQLRDQPPMTTPPRRFGAHEARVRLPQRGVERPPPPPASHPPRVASERLDADAIELVLPRLVRQAAAQLDGVPIRDARYLGRRPGLRAGGLGVPGGPGETRGV